jgi:hypothetical protein
VQVVDGEHERAALRQVGDQPIEAVEHREGALVVGEVGDRHRSRPEERGGERGGALDGRLAVLCARTRDDRLEALADDAERERPLELAAAGRQDGDASAWARSRSSRGSAVVPIPAAPSITARRPAPATTAASAASSASISSSRSRSSAETAAGVVADSAKAIEDRAPAERLRAGKPFGKPFGACP